MARLWQREMLKRPMKRAQLYASLVRLYSSVLLMDGMTRTQAGPRVCQITASQTLHPVTSADYFMPFSPFNHPLEILCLPGFDQERRSNLPTNGLPPQIWTGNYNLGLAATHRSISVCRRFESSTSANIPPECGSCYDCANT
jgi:hypothetical protein